MTTLLFACLTTALFYLGSRATITSWLWSRYPRWIAAFMDCAACSGFWYGFTLELIYGRARGLAPFGLNPAHFETPIVVGLCSIVLTPILAAVLQVALHTLGTALAPEEPAEPEPPLSMADTKAYLYGLARRDVQ